MSPPSTKALTRKPTVDEALGMAWWNGFTRPERARALTAAEAALARHASIADAWVLWKTARISTAPPGLRALAL